MQATNVQEKTDQWLGTAVTVFMVIIALLLFGWVIGRMGLLNRVGGAETAVPGPSFHLTAEAMRFGQAEIRVKAGQPATLVLDNHDLYEHSFDVDELDLHVAMTANGRTEFTFTPSEAGTYTIYCNVPGHREAGMVSSLVVAE